MTRMAEGRTVQTSIATYNRVHCAISGAIADERVVNDAESGCTEKEELENRKKFTRSRLAGIEMRRNIDNYRRKL